MDKRILLGCIAALATMLVFGLLAALLGTRFEGVIDTGFGSIALIDLVSTLVAMTAGGWVARRRFRWVAVTLDAISWIAILGLLLAMAGPTSPAPMRSLPALLEYHGLAIVLSLVLAWTGAMLGERLAMRRVAAAG